MAISKPVLPPWFRAAQPGGGRSKFHLLVDHRRGHLSPPRFAPPTAPVTFGLAACGYTFIDPLEIQIGTDPAVYRPGVLLPLDGRGRPMREYHSDLLCERCCDLAWALLNSNPV